ncbi:alpha/beta hydrolase [Sciscionella sediminilitoris]|uniref:alpha/beta hydrolase n=1 Tax=Sciscionella sediminilitoris TaxID=1445613 RepID=UPI0009E96FE9|nr:alpha/beta hydrolase [Sciscionella sp. SE31]
MEPMGIPATQSRSSRYVANTLRVMVRPAVDLLPATSLSVLAARGLLDTVLPALAPPRRARIRAERTYHEGKPVRGEWVHGPAPLRTDAVVLYLHGGAFLCGSPRSHRGLIAQLSTRAGLPVFSLDYRLAPRHRYPAAAEDVLNAFRLLLARGYPADRVVVAGDSAGGHLALGLAIAAREQGLPQPAALVLFSPLVDFSANTAAAVDEHRRDPYLSARLAKRMLPLYGRSGEPGLELLRGDLSGLPPILLQAGDAEMLSGDARALASLVNTEGGDCTLEIWPGQVHVFQALYRLLPEARGALAHAGHYIRTRLGEPMPQEARQAPLSGGSTPL